ncbi:MAG: hypothetical protein M3N29_04330 [Chloroflexota bacterium]|nr:hypothetical protein [Chloroflexota bacterium]
MVLVAAIAVAMTALLRGASGDTAADGNGPRPTDAPASPTPPSEFRTIDVANIAAEIPSGWTVVRSVPDTIVAADPQRRAMWLRSGVVPTALTLDSLQQLLVERLSEQSPNARLCAGPETAQVPGATIAGRYFVVCYIHVPQGGGVAAQLSDAFYVGVDASGTIPIVMQLTAPPASIDEFAGMVHELPAPRWKLLSAE